MTRRTSALIVALAALLALAGVLTACSSSHPSGGTSSSPSALNDGAQGSGKFQGIGLDPAQPRPAFTLTDTSGATFDFGTATAGHPTLLYFGYTNCPDICPETMADIELALKQVPAAVQAATYVVFVTTDVKRDTAATIAEWLGHFSAGQTARFVGLRGTQAEINAAQAAAHVTLAEDDGETHSAEVLLYGANNYAEVSYAFNGSAEQTQIAHDLPLVAKA